ncbi:T9SS type A sorting domain-containing protein, partial [candidate division KSB1 bacterium]|nr:T9SS type A sorting domain-containing protein [candidate division KSB1 bacterium]
EKELKVDPPEGGTYSLDCPNATVTVTITDNKYLAFTSTIPIKAVIMKGGPDAYVYDYGTPGTTGDNNLRCPDNEGGNVPEISHYNFCYVCPSPPPEPAIEIEKATNGEDADLPTGPKIRVGDPVTWTYLVTNTGDVPLNNITVTDDKGVVVTLPATTLAPGESMIGTATGIATAGQYQNVATVAGLAPDGTRVTDTDPSHYYGEEPEGGKFHDLNKNGLEEYTEPLLGGWTIVLKNLDTGAEFTVQTISDPADPNFGKWFFPENLPAGTYLVSEVLQSGWVQSCPPGGTYTILYKADGTYELLSTPPPGFHELDFGNYEFTANPDIDIEKATNGEDADSPPGPEIHVGDPVTWTYVVKNTGNVPLCNIIVTDDQGVTPAYQSGDDNKDGCLDLTETWLYEAKGSAVLGQYKNTGKVTGDYKETTVIDEDPSHYIGTEKPVQKLIIKKTVEGFNPKPVKFTFEVAYPDGSTETVELNLNAGTDVSHQKQLPTETGIHVVTESDAEGYEHVSPTPVTVTVPEGGEATAAFVNKVKTTCIEGHVFDNGQPAVGVLVRLDSKDVPKSTKHLTNANGYYYFGGVIIGLEYTVSVPSLGLSETITVSTVKNENDCAQINFNGGVCKPVLAWYEGWYAGHVGDDALRYWSPNNLGGVNDTSIVGLYDSYDPDIWEYHILLAWASDIDAFVVDWYGKDAYEQTPTKGLLDAAQRLYERFQYLGFDFQIIISYNETAIGDLNENLEFIKNNILTHPAYWGNRTQTYRPLFVFCEKKELCCIKFNQAVDTILPDDVLVFWNFDECYQEIAEYVDGFYPWVQATNGNWDPNGMEWGEGYLQQYYNLVPPLHPSHFIGAVWPGYDDREWIFGQNHYIDRQDTLVYTWTWEDAFVYQPDWLLVESWNTFERSTHIEVAKDFGYKFVKLTRNKCVFWKSSCARNICDMGLTVPECVWKARKRLLSDGIIDQALLQFFSRNFDQALAILNIQTTPTPPPQERDARLVFVEGTQAFVKEPWDNAVDGDLEGWDGTTTVKYFDSGAVFGVFRFADHGLYMFDTIFIQTDNGSDDDKYSDRQATDIEVLVSTSGLGDGDFNSVARIYPKYTTMRYYNIGSPVVATYIKLILHGPKWGQGGWIQIVEFGVGNGKIGQAEPLSETAGLAQMPAEFCLDQNYPNPFNPTTTIRYALPEAAKVTLTIYDLNGREISRLVDGNRGAGYHSVVWNAAGIPSGLYYYRLQACDRVATKRLVLLK